MKEFLEHDLKLESNSKITKMRVEVEDTSKYPIPIRDQIKEISKDQFKIEM